MTDRPPTVTDAQAAEIRRRAAREIQKYIDRVARRVEQAAPELEEYRLEEFERQHGFRPAHTGPGRPQV